MHLFLICVAYVSYDRNYPTCQYIKERPATCLETGRYPKLCCNHRLCPKRPLADEQSQMGKYRLARCLLFITVSFVPLDLNLPGISRIAQYGPVCCVVWEGHLVRGVPIPICGFSFPFHIFKAWCAIVFQFNRTTTNPYVVSYKL